MCRHLAYIGAPRTLHELLYAPPRSLHSQSYAPREQSHGTVNADGFGVGWYGADGAEPIRYRRAMPMWADVSFADVARVVETSCAVAAVRDATVGFPVDEGCAQPFRADTWLFSHNGAVEDYEVLVQELAAPAPTGVLDAHSPVDSAPLFAAAVRLWRRGQSLGAALAEVVATARVRSPGRYNLLAADGGQLAATACGDSLYTRRLADAVVIASEPYDDDPAWRRVPDGSLVVATTEGVAVTDVEHA